MDHSSYVYIDADVLVALNDLKDPNHKNALKCIDFLEDREIKLITSELVLLEVLTVLSKKLGKLSATDVIKRIEDSDIVIVKLSSQTFTDSLIINNLQKSKNIGAFDTYHMQEMKNLKIGTVLSFDKAFKKNGFTRVIDLVLP